MRNYNDRQKRNSQNRHYGDAGSNRDFLNKRDYHNSFNRHPETFDEHEAEGYSSPRRRELFSRRRRSDDNRRYGSGFKNLRLINQKENREWENRQRQKQQFS